MQMTVFLPGGYIDECGTLHREADLMPLSGCEEELLERTSRHGSAAAVTAVLSRCMRRLGTISPVPEQLVRHLLVADRHYLLLKLRDLTFGDQVQATVSCPWTDCGRKIDIAFSLRDVPVTESQEKGPIYTVELSSEAVGGDEHADRSITFRLPNGVDQEVVTPMISGDAEKALATLISRCIQPGDSRSLSPLAIREIKRRMEAVAPKIEMNIAGQCRECGREFELPFDAQKCFLAELRTSQDLLQREVHYLAYHYHWSEHEIMAMPREKRRRYIEVLTDELERVNHGD